MAKNYSYPRVTMSTFAKKHSHNVINVPDTTIMFAPLVTEKGPDDRIVKIHTLAEFIETFGSFNEEFYNLNGQMALNIYNWLSNGGTLMVKRLTSYPTIKNDDTTGGVDTVVPVNSTLAIGGASILRISSDFTFGGSDLIVNGICESTETNEDTKTTTRIEISKFDSFKSAFKVTNNGIIGDKRIIVVQTKIVESISKKTKSSNVEWKRIYTLNEAASTIGSENSVLKYEYKVNGTSGTPFIITINKKEEIYEAYDKNGNKVTGFFVDDDADCTHDEHNANCYFKIWDSDSETGSDTLTPVALTSKYCGSYYNNVYLEATRVGKGTPAVFNFTIYYEDPITKKSIALEKFLQKTEDTYMAALSSSEYVNVINIGGDLFFEETTTKKIPQSKKYTLCGAVSSITDYKKTLKAVEEYWEVEGSDPTTEDTRKRYLVNKLETPIDIIFDAGYPTSIKDAMVAFVRNDGNDGIDAKRDDIICILDNWQLANDLRLALPEEIIYATVAEPWTLSVTRPTNVAIYEQYFTILDDTFTNQNIYVTPTYFLTKLFAYNDQTYGLQYPTAGLRRGILDDATAVNLNPSPDQKEAWFVERVNYVEKTSREYAFMSQRTFDGSSDMEYTALSFLNNERVLERMKKDLEALGRSYLHEFNDAVTIANMTTVLNKYVANWISNRTLSMGVVTVEQNAVSENALDINLNIKFTNTIEVIHVSIVIE